MYSRKVVGMRTQFHEPDRRVERHRTQRESPLGLLFVFLLLVGTIWIGHLLFAVLAWLWQRLWH